MEIAHKLLEQFNNAEKKFSSLPYYNILLSIETAYQLNPNLISFSYEKGYKYETVELSKKYFDITPCFESDIITDKDDISISNIGRYTLFKDINKHNILSLDINDNLIFDFLNKFENLKNRNDRFDIYQQYFDNIIFDIENIISEWKQPDFIKNNQSKPIEIKSLISIENNQFFTFEYPTSLSLLNNSSTIENTIFNNFDNSHKSLKEEIDKLKILNFMENIHDLLFHKNHKEIFLNISLNNINIQTALSYSLDNLFIDSEYMEISLMLNSKYSNRLNKENFYDEFKTIFNHLNLKNLGHVYISLYEKEELNKMLPLNPAKNLNNTNRL